MKKAFLSWHGSDYKYKTSLLFLKTLVLWLPLYFKGFIHWEILLWTCPNMASQRRKVFGQNDVRASGTQVNRWQVPSGVSFTSLMESTSLTYFSEHTGLISSFKFVYLECSMGMSKHAANLNASSHTMLES